MRFGTNRVRSAFQFFLAIAFFINSSCEETIQKLNNKDYNLSPLFTLPEVLAESSGCIVFDSLIWTINDGGNRPEIYAISLLTGEISKTIQLIDTENIDWEDIAQDQRKIFIGDIGNHNGERTDLAIYVIEKSAISSEELQSIIPEKISFVFEDQEDFEYAHHATFYDCEAMFIANDSIYLMTKDWIEETSTVYVIPTLPGEYQARKIETIKSNGLVTAADFEPETKQLIVCGYDNYLPFVWFYDMGMSNSISKANSRRIDLSNKFGYQYEGICIFDDKYILTNENSAFANSTAWLLSLVSED